MNTDLRDGLNFLLAGKPLAILGKNGSQSITHNVSANVTWDLETVDRDSGHSTVTNNSRYTAQTAGWYRVQGSVLWASSGTGIRDCGFLTNGSIQSHAFTGVGSSIANTCMQNEGLILLSVGDYVEFLVYQNSGGALSVSPTWPDQRNRFVLEWVSS